MTDAERPRCRCHDEPMLKNGHNPNGPQKWWCATKRRRYKAAQYDALSGVAYNRLLLRHRRVKALARMKQRQERHAET